MTAPPQTFILAGLLLLLSTAWQCAGAMETRIIQLKHRNADDVLPTLLPLLEGEGRISGRQYQLFVRTSEHNFAEIEHVLNEIDTPLRNLRISVRHADNGTLTSSVQQVTVDQRIGNNTRIVLSPATSTHGGLIAQRHGTDGTDGTVQYRTERRTTVHTQDSRQFVSVIEGRRAYNAVGMEVPQVETFLVLAGNHLVRAAGVTYRSVTTGFEVLPRVHGAEVDLEITPRMAFVSDQGSQQVSFSELGTHVRVKIGEWVELGGVLSDANEVGRRILDTRTRRSQEQSGFQVRVDE